MKWRELIPRTVMTKKDEVKRLAKTLDDKARKTAIVGNQALVPHKFTPSGDVVTQENFDAKTCLSRLNLNDLSFLVLWKKGEWNDDAVIEKCGLPPEQAKKTLKRLAYFKTEDVRIRVLASEATPERILAKDMESVEAGGTLNDSQHKSLDRAAKIIGAFKTSDVTITQNVYNMPQLSPEDAKKAREFFDTIAVENTNAA